MNFFLLPQTCRSWVAVALCSGFLTRHFLTKSVNSSDQSSGFLNVGGGLVGIMKIAWRNTDRIQNKVRLEQVGYVSTDFLSKARLHLLSWDECQHREVFLLPSL